MPPNKEEEQQKEMQEFIVSEVKSIYTSKKMATLSSVVMQVYLVCTTYHRLPLVNSQQ